MCRDPFTCIIYTHQKMKAWQYMPIREARCVCWEGGEGVWVCVLGGRGGEIVCVCGYCVSCHVSSNIWKIYLEQGEYERAKRFAEVGHRVKPTC